MQQLTSGTLLQGGKYKIERVLGQGGFGITYQAYQEMLDRSVCIKEFFFKDFCERNTDTSHVTMGTTSTKDLVQKFMAKFVKEARTIAKFHHPNIISIIDIFEENGTAYYVMEFIDGESLSDMVNRNGALNEQQAIMYIHKVADALAYVHEHKINHLDVKPANIMIRKADNEPVLIDFGLAKQYDMETSNQTSTTPVGISHGYAPIEQYRQGGVSEFSPQSDIYSLGATLYKIVTGNTPPESSLLLDEEEILSNPGNISSCTWCAIEKAMEPKRKKRPQTISEFLMLLDVKDKMHESAGVKETMTTEKYEETQVIVENTEETVVLSREITPERHKNGIIKAFNVNGVDFNMVFVEGATFVMKETVSSGFLGFSEKTIKQETTLSDYMIGETVVTQELWEAVMGNNPSKGGKGKKMPVTNVSWTDCSIFVKALSNITRAKFRLPSEAEWEFAAKGGRNSKNYRFAGSDCISDVGWADDYKLHSVAEKKPNELGLYDMSGGVWEWCADGVGNYKDGKFINPIGDHSDHGRICRGGSSFDYSRFCTNTLRFDKSKDENYEDTGLRLVLEV